MRHEVKLGFSIAMALMLAGGVAAAQEDQHQQPAHQQPQHQPARPARPPVKGEPHAGPKGYTRAAQPEGLDKRPATVDRGAYQHNFQAARSYKIGPYVRPRGWVSHHWAYGQVLPRVYWSSQYLIGDYWLFGLEVPPMGFEWVRDDDDAILVNTGTGEILQVEYGVFA